MKYIHDIGAVIAARGGSVRVPDKNIKPFGDTNLLEHKINQLRQLSGLSGIYVSSDSEKILNIADNSGAYSIDRDSKYCTNEVSINEVVTAWKHSLNYWILRISDVQSETDSGNTNNTSRVTLIENFHKALDSKACKLYVQTLQ